MEGVPTIHRVCIDVVRVPVQTRGDVPRAREAPRTPHRQEHRGMRRVHRSRVEHIPVIVAHPAVECSHAVVVHVRNIQRAAPIDTGRPRAAQLGRGTESPVAGRSRGAGSTANHGGDGTGGTDVPDGVIAVVHHVQRSTRRRIDSQTKRTLQCRAGGTTAITRKSRCVECASDHG